jgi:DNA-binding MarR family transcriptional regulator
MTAGQYTILSLLDNLEPTTSAALARRLSMTAQSMGQFIQTLETKGLVERFVNPNHGRKIDIRLTAKGRKMLARCDKRVDEAERAFFAPLSPAELASFREMAARLRVAQDAKKKAP